MRFLSRYPEGRSSRGFTMVEILIVISIMAVLSGIAIPSFYRWTTSIRYRSTALSISSALRQGRDLAITNNRELRLDFDVDARRYRLTRGNLSSGSTSWSVVNPWEGLSVEVNWATGTGCDGTADETVTFRPNGSSTGVTVCIMDKVGNERFKVSASSITGRVRVE